MTFPLFRSPLDLAHHFWEKLIQPGDIVIDATCGNGHDTLFLGKLKIGKLYSMDIQAKALEATEERLKRELSDEQLKKIALIHGCHSQFPSEIAAGTVRLIVYNLGYLPGGNKTITTHRETTLKSVKEALTLLMPGGLICITCYPGHEEGALEETLLLDFATHLDKELWSASHNRWINRHKSPSLLLLQNAIGT